MYEQFSCKRGPGAQFVELGAYSRCCDLVGEITGTDANDDTTALEIVLHGKTLLGSRGRWFTKQEAAALRVKCGPRTRRVHFACVWLHELDRPLTARRWERTDDARTETDKLGYEYACILVHLNFVHDPAARRYCWSVPFPCGRFPQVEKAYALAKLLQSPTSLYLQAVRASLFPAAQRPPRFIAGDQPTLLAF